MTTFFLGIWSGENESKLIRREKKMPLILPKKVDNGKHVL
jgi:hypothetical protein